MPMGKHFCLTLLVIVVAGTLLFAGGATPDEAIPVRYAEGLIHGFLVLRTMSGEAIADGDLIQVARRDRVTSRLIFHLRTVLFTTKLLSSPSMVPFDC
ncbi:MAG: hypothetical protein JWQ87_358 [Candidatus Sulfotelmatobacter sp.]|nr:hypothetical protein [Candidatus Sulfotelmatobacter sp.]